MNVMEIISGADVNGAVVHCLLLTRALLRRGNEVTLVCRPDAWIARQLAGEPVHVIESEMARLPLGELGRIAGIARQRSIDVAHTHMTRAHNFGAWLRRLYGVPCVATAHSHFVHPHWAMADRVLAICDATRRYHRTHNLLSARKVVTVYGFADCARFAGLPVGASPAARADLGLPAEAPVIGIVGDIIPRKGQIHAVRALPRVMEAYPAAHVIMVGETKGCDRYRNIVHAEAQRLGVGHAVTFTGYRADIACVLSALDVYVLSSLEEMFPVALLEAMAAGRAVVATTVGGVPECVIPNSTGLLVRPGDSAGLAQALISLLRDAGMRHQLGAEARRLVGERFSVGSQAPAVERELATVAGEARRWHERRRAARGCQ